MTVNVAQLATLNWRGARDQAQAVVSLGDLIDGEHGRGEVARRAAEAYDQMARVTACLHAEFSAVLPSIRLEWAERLSQFDAAPRLRDLSVLPRWPQVEYIDRRKMQAFVDWLFDQVDARGAARAGPDERHRADVPAAGRRRADRAHPGRPAAAADGGAAGRAHSADRLRCGTAARRHAGADLQRVAGAGPRRGRGHRQRDLGPGHSNRDDGSESRRRRARAVRRDRPGQPCAAARDRLPARAKAF